MALAMTSLASFAADFYVVTPVPGKKVNASAIQVALSTANLPGAVVGTAYSYNFNQNLQVTGDPTYSGYGLKWSITSGALPAGLSLDASTGTPSRTPPATGTVQPSSAPQVGLQSKTLALNEAGICRLFCCAIRRRGDFAHL